MPRIVSFDVWKTLIRADKAYAPYRAKVVAEALGWTVSQDTIKAAFSQAAKELDKLTDRTGDQYSLSHRAQRVCEIIGMPRLTPREMNLLHDTIHTAQLEYPPTLMEADLPETLKQLKQRGFKLAIICNTGNAPGYTLHDVLEMRGVIEHIDYPLWSDALEVAKPSPKIFGKLVEISGVPAHEIVHVGDNIHTDYNGARAAGFNSLLYAPAGLPADTTVDSYTHHSELLTHPLVGDTVPSR